MAWGSKELTKSASVGCRAVAWMDGSTAGVCSCDSISTLPTPNAGLRGGIFDVTNSVAAAPARHDEPTTESHDACTSSLGIVLTTSLGLRSATKPARSRVNPSTPLVVAECLDKLKWLLFNIVLLLLVRFLRFLPIKLVLGLLFRCSQLETTWAAH